MQRTKQDKRPALKQGITADDSRRKREDQQSELRKNKREQGLMQKRRLTTNPSAQIEESAEVVDFTSSSVQGSLPQYVVWCNGGDANLQLSGVTAIRKLLSIQNNPPIADVIASGVLPRLVEFLGIVNNSKLQFEAAWALTNIASGSSEQTQTLVQCNAVPSFVHLLSFNDEELVDQAIWALGNIAGDSPNLRNLVLHTGVMSNLNRILSGNCRISIQRNATWLLSNLCRGKPQPPAHLIAPALPILARLIHSSDQEVTIDACWALSYLSDGDDTAIQTVLNAGVAVRLVELLSSSSHQIQTPSLRAVGNIVSGNEAQTQAILELKALPSFYQLMLSSRKALKKESAWAISNICAGTKEQCITVLHSNVFPQIIHLYNNAEFDVKKECAWAVSNALSWKIPTVVRGLVDLGCLKPIVGIMGSQDNKMIQVGLDSLEAILTVGSNSKTGENIYSSVVEEAEGIDRLEGLQEHKVEEIYKKALNLLETYFGGEEENENNTAPNVAANHTFNFGGNFVAPTTGFAF